MMPYGHIVISGAQAAPTKTSCRGTQASPSSRSWCSSSASRWVSERPRSSSTFPEYFPNDVGAVGGLVGMLGASAGSSRLRCSRTRRLDVGSAVHVRRDLPRHACRSDVDAPHGHAGLQKQSPNRRTSSSTARGRRSHESLTPRIPHLLPAHTSQERRGLVMTAVAENPAVTDKAATASSARWLHNWNP